MSGHDDGTSARRLYLDGAGEDGGGAPARRPPSLRLVEGNTPSPPPVAQSFALERDGAWIAQELGQRLGHRLETDPARPLAPLLETCLAELVDTYHLVPGETPSTTVAIVRLNGDIVDVLVLCDSPVIVLDTNGTVHQIRDDRLADTAATIDRPDGLADMTDPRWITSATTFEKLRNHPDGFWVASATPEAARHAIQWHHPAAQIDTILAMTDGASAGVDDYGTPPTWHEAIQLAATDPAGLLALVHNTEATDPDATRWPRSKRHDDKAIAVIRTRT